MFYRGFVFLFAVLMLLSACAFAADMSSRRFGNTGEKMAVAGIEASANCSRDAFKAVLRNASRAGSVFVSASPYVDGGEQFVAENIGPSYLSRCLLATYWKTDNDDKEDDLVRRFNSSMKSMNVDCIDCIVIDDIRESRYLKKNCITKAFYRLKKERKTRYLGVYVKKTEKEPIRRILSYVIKTGDFDFIVLDYSVDNFREISDYIEVIGQKGMGVVVKGVIGDSLKNPELARRIARRKSLPLEQAVMQWAVSSNRWISSILVEPSDLDVVKKVLDGCGDEDNSSIFDIR